MSQMTTRGCDSALEAALRRWLDALDVYRLPGFVLNPKWDEVYDEVVESRKNLEKVAREVPGRE